MGSTTSISQMGENHLQLSQGSVVHRPCGCMRGGGWAAPAHDATEAGPPTTAWLIPTSDDSAHVESSQFRHPAWILPRPHSCRWGFPICMAVVVLDARDRYPGVGSYLVVPLDEYPGRSTIHYHALVWKMEPLNSSSLIHQINESERQRAKFTC